MSSSRRIRTLQTHLSAREVGNTVPQQHGSAKRGGVDDRGSAKVGNEKHFAGVESVSCSTVVEKTFTLEELRKFDGSGGGKVYLAVKNVVYDVSTGRGFYGPGGGYEMLGGRDASRALALMSMDPADAENSSLDGLTEKNLATLENWAAKMAEKYPIVGTLER